MKRMLSTLAFLVLSLGCESGSLVKPVTVIAVASDGDNASPLISDAAERSPYYLIFADTGELLDVIDNPYSGGRGDVAPAVLSLLAQSRVGVIVAARFSPEMIAAMKARGIRHLRFEGVARDAVDRMGGRDPKTTSVAKGDNR
jgi:predicted Fe-Mo cluster-binding NifX family protein